MKELENAANNHISETDYFLRYICNIPDDREKKQLFRSLNYAYSDPVSSRLKGKGINLWRVIITRTWRGQLREGAGGWEERKDLAINVVIDVNKIIESRQLADNLGAWYSAVHHPGSD